MVAEQVFNFIEPVFISSERRNLGTQKLVTRFRGLYFIRQRCDCVDDFLILLCHASDVCEYSAPLFLLGKTVSSPVSMSACCGGSGRQCVVRVAPVTISSKYPAVVRGATVGDLDDPGLLL